MRVSTSLQAAASLLLIGAAVHNSSATETNPIVLANKKCHVDWTDCWGVHRSIDWECPPNNQCQEQYVFGTTGDPPKQCVAAITTGCVATPPKSPAG